MVRKPGVQTHISSEYKLSLYRIRVPWSVL
jgi:hypothetical protein